MASLSTGPIVCPHYRPLSIRLLLIIILILIITDTILDTRSICSHSTRSVVGGSRTSKVSTMLSGTTLACKDQSKQGDLRNFLK